MTQPSTSEAKIAESSFIDLHRAGRLRHVRNPVLSAAVKAYKQRRVGDGMLWQRRGATADVEPAVAAALATWALEHVKRIPRSKV
ncbi:MAG TPA: hypothetical protein VFH23_17115 [Jiangellaceae bacterium]|nr:hypothetical protein [Jiangellaceae bacterium]